MIASLIMVEWDKILDCHGVKILDRLKRLIEVKVKMWIKNYIGFMLLLK